MISIVSGTLNRLELLKQVIKNTVDNSEKVELVLVDGGSTDGTIDYLRSLNHPRIKLIEVGHRSNYAHYMNLGIRNSTYELVAQWNDDVLIMNDWEEVINTLDDSDFYIFSWLRGTEDEFYNDKENLWKKQYLLFSGCVNFGIYKKDIFRKIGMYDSAFQYGWVDSDMAERSIRFGFKKKECRNIRVMEILGIEKRASDSVVNGEIVLAKNKQLYQNRQIPDTVEYL